MNFQDQSFKSVSIAILSVACLSCLIGFYLWLQQQRVYAPIIEQLNFTVTLSTKFFVETNPAFICLPLITAGAFLVWREVKQGASKIGLGLNLAFLIVSILVIWGADSSLRGNVDQVIRDLSK